MAEPKAVAQVEWEIGGIKFSMTGDCADPADANRILDGFRNAVWRQQAYLDLMENLTKLRQIEDAIRTKPETRAAKLADRIAKRAATIAEWEAKHTASGKRADFQLSHAARVALRTFDAETEAELAKIDESARVAAEITIPALQRQIAMNRRMIELGDRCAVLDEVGQARAIEEAAATVAEAAE